MWKPRYSYLISVIAALSSVCDTVIKVPLRVVNYLLDVVAEAYDYIQGHNFKFEKITGKESYFFASARYLGSDCLRHKLEVAHDNLSSRSLGWRKVALLH